MIRGQRFELDLTASDNDEADDTHTRPLPATFVADVLERKPAALPKPPSAPTPRSGASAGFPTHTRRTVFRERNHAQTDDRTSHAAGDRFRQRQQHGMPRDTSPTPHLSEKEQIDRENRQRLDAMTPAEIEEERRELMSSFSPAFIQRLLKRADMQSASNETDLGIEDGARAHGRSVEEKESSQKQKPRDLQEQDDSAALKAQHKINVKTSIDADTQEAQSNVGVKTQSDVRVETDHQPLETDSEPNPPAIGSIHFPQPSQPPDLDPSSATFLNDLHEKYFPSLPSDPAKLAWMMPANPDDPSASASLSAYDPGATSFRPADIRFSFRGELLAPKTAAAIPVTAGLHHHADAPDAAGYTIPELAHLSRSTFPAQRCIAFQTLGRVLFRLGRGEFGNPSAGDEPSAQHPHTPSAPSEPSQTSTPLDAENTATSLADLARGLWREVDRLRVVPTLIAESEGHGVDAGRHLSARAYATEAVWLWQKGGGRRWTAA